ncbi:Blp family class II bacteriocin [Streptococcus cuniculipharyngis]|uniref:ComC/BlpC family leader-containing pheromone/bacteriocin n=1 Tax=Streptococcus cuniculipharyngis TaxID=1562651 RepID=A0A5C5SF89_9STRE|nr:Blp family class II bacteriocin [Streptococcus cuniculipharyngis]TWS98803.1 ComC/BlpC family leader-containing pheromone/bacteriocin [Streptococcus cuniculipharyngis]
MNTKTISQFELLDTEHLATVEGGVSNKCIAAIVGGAVWGGSRGLVGGPLAGGIGTAVGAAAGAIIGCR